MREGGIRDKTYDLEYSDLKLLSQLKTEIGQYKQSYATCRRSHTSKYDLHSFTSITKYALSIHIAHACVYTVDPLIRKFLSPVYLPFYNAHIKTYLISSEKASLTFPKTCGYL